MWEFIDQHGYSIAIFDGRLDAAVVDVGLFDSAQEQMNRSSITPKNIAGPKRSNGICRFSTVFAPATFQAASVLLRCSLYFEMIAVRLVHASG
jgi:hypothetical protein